MARSASGSGLIVTSEDSAHEPSERWRKLRRVSKGRLEAFSDGVIAVAITLLALNLPVPSPSAPGTLAHHLGQQWPHFAAYVVSFVTIGIIWVNHHAMLRRIVGVDHAILTLNLALLLTIGVLPFSTALMAEYLKSSHGQNLAAVIYGGSFLLMSSAFFAMQRHLLRAKPHLLAGYLTPDLRGAVLRRNVTGLPPYVIATLAGIVSPYITLGICAAIAAFYAAPATTSDVNEQAAEHSEQPAAHRSQDDSGNATPR
jgi:uncharacterized membrane protein